MGRWCWQTKDSTSSRCGSMVMNRTSNHEDAGSIPGLAQWVKDLVLLPWAALWWCRWKTWLISGVAVAVASSYSTDQTPNLGTSICCGCTPPQRTPWDGERVNRNEGNWMSDMLGFFFGLFLGLLPQHNGGSQARGLNRSCSCWPIPQPKQRQIQAASATYTTAHGNAGSLTHWARPRIEPTASWFLVIFVNHCATRGTSFFLCLINIYL